MNHHRGKQSSKICFSIKCWEQREELYPQWVEIEGYVSKFLDSGAATDLFILSRMWKYSFVSTRILFDIQIYNYRNDNKSKMIYVIKRTFTMIECWCSSIIFGNDLLVKLDNWFSEPFLGNIVSSLRRKREGERGNYRKSLAVSCNAMNVWLFCSKQQRSSCPL